MLANETMVAADGHEVSLFPLEVLNMTQDEGSDFSHAGTYNIDLIGRSANAPLYAPCTMKLTTKLTDGSNGQIWESTETVHLPNGDLDYLTLLVAHCDLPPYQNIGTVVSQGTLFYRTGTAGFVTGDHVHLCCGQGQGGYMVQRPSGNWDLSNRIHSWEGLYVNDTEIIQGYGHDWIEWDGPTPGPGQRRKRHFPWPVAWHNWKNFSI